MREKSESVRFLQAVFFGLIDNGRVKAEDVLLALSNVCKNRAVFDFSLSAAEGKKLGQLAAAIDKCIVVVNSVEKEGSE